ncbi:RHS repeat domain-containing protein [Pseudomonas sp. NPDC088368]|uniref:RHS repeat domain-containing protein n=1 Tax=Pseudomonas sp. NPDC088368 TaxID=3364453 RepID=UPI003801E9D0
MGLHSFSPHLHAIEPRGLLAREVAWHRIDQIDEAQARVTRHVWDEAGRSVADWDPRLWEKAATANLRKTPSLSGQTLLDESVDAGWRLELSGADGQSVERWDGRGSYSRTDYDECLRAVSVTENLIDAQPNVVERYTYGDPSALSAEHNQCGRLIRHDDPAGTLCAQEFGLAGGVLIENRRFLQTDEQPDWPLDSGQRDALLEPGIEHTTTTVFDAAASLVCQTDAVGNRTEHLYNVGGFLWETRLKLANAQTFQTLISDLHYNPTGQLESEHLGNGVISEKTYEPQSGRLTRIFSSRAGNTVLQDLNYRYDPVGNVVEIEDAAQATRFFTNQRIDPVSRYRYDTLYQLIEATGREVSTGASHGPALPTLQNLAQDPNQLSNYTQRYDYDAGGNLREMRHVGAQSFTRTMLVAPDSNRSLPEGDVDPDFDKGFDANGNLQQLIRGQDLYWDVRNQLRSVRAVERENGSNDEERYVYDGSGQRGRKIRSTLAKSRILVGEVRYLPSLELRTEASGETLQVSMIQTGGNNVRVLHWPNEKPEGIANNQIRYSLNDHLGSSTLKLDDKGELISQESYYPFGGTSWWAARSAVEAKYKTIRYSGKERDASGLYYYGFRYYAPWLQRWLAPDGIESVDGLNLYQMVANCPMIYIDRFGQAKENSTLPFTDVDPSDTWSKKFNISEEKGNLIKSVYTHEMRDRHTIVSKYHPPGHPLPNLFINKFEPDVWTFKNNTKPIKETTNLYANDIATFQYFKVASAEGFLGALPSLIIRNNISNMGVKKMARQYESDTPEFTQAFLTQTQNGKSTQRILDHFGLRALKIEHSLNDIGMLDIHIHVEKKTSLPTAVNTSLEREKSLSSEFFKGLKIRRSSLDQTTPVRTRKSPTRRNSDTR